MTDPQALCPKCSGPARVTRELLDRLNGTVIVTRIKTTCLSAQCGDNAEFDVRGDQR